MPSFISTGAAPARLKNSAICWLPGNIGDSSIDTAAAVVPSTSAWLPPMNTPMVPSSAGICVVWMYWFSSRINWSRLSSRSLGVWPLPLVRAICSLTSAMLLARSLIEVTLLPSCSLTA